MICGARIVWMILIFHIAPSAVAEYALRYLYILLFTFNRNVTAKLTKTAYYCVIIATMRCTHIVLRLRLIRCPTGRGTAPNASTLPEGNPCSKLYYVRNEYSQVVLRDIVRRKRILRVVQVPRRIILSISKCRRQCSSSNRCNTACWMQRNSLLWMKSANGSPRKT